MPVRPPVIFPDPGIGMDFMHESYSQDDGRQDHLDHQENPPVQPVQPQNVRPSDHSVTRDDHVTKKTVERAYFTRFIERMETVREINPEKDQHDQPETSIVKEPAGVISDDPMIINNNLIERKAVPKGPGIFPEKNSQEEKIIELSGIIPVQETYDDGSVVQQKQNLPPPPKQESKKINEIKPVDSPVERILLSQPVPRENVPVQKDIRQETPKLVIGKIIVEIVPPVNPPPARSITRIVPSTQESGFSKSSKLSFGLGQL